MINSSSVAFDPTRDNVIVRDVEVDENNESAIKTPNSNISRDSLSADTRITGAVVLAVGPELNYCEKGDIILYISDESYTMDNEGTKIIGESAILAIGVNLRNK